MKITFWGFMPYLLAGLAVAIAEGKTYLTARGAVALVLVVIAVMIAEENGERGRG